MWKIHQVYVETGKLHEGTAVIDGCKIMVVNQIIVFITVVRKKRLRLRKEKKDIIFLDISAAYTQNVYNSELISQVKILPKSVRKILRYVKHLKLGDDVVNHLIEDKIPFAIEYRLDSHPS